MARVMAGNLMCGDAKEGISAFIAKRGPRMDEALTPRINIVTLGVRDLATMKSFYERLGLKASSAGNERVAFFQLNGCRAGPLWLR